MNQLIFADRQKETKNICILLPKFPWGKRNSYFILCPLLCTFDRQVMEFTPKIWLVDSDVCVTRSNLVLPLRNKQAKLGWSFLFYNKKLHRLEGLLPFLSSWSCSDIFLVGISILNLPFVVTCSQLTNSQQSHCYCNLNFIDLILFKTP